LHVAVFIQREAPAASSIIAAKVHLYRADEVLHSVRPSVCLSRAYDLLKLGMP